MWLNRKSGFERISRLGAAGKDFLFVISYDRSRIFAETLERLPAGIKYKLEGWSNCTDKVFMGSCSFEKQMIPYRRYRKSLEAVKDEIKAGNTYLLNLTFPIPIVTNLDMGEIFRYSRAKYKLFIPDLFTCFSPEKFICIKDNRVCTFPMKGTIDANISDAEKKILNDPKETAEHIMITDLMRNDLNRIASSTRVVRFRYTDRIKAGEKELLQISSEISAELPSNWRSTLGTILEEITPAGSITGTPKKKTMEIIQKIENYERGFYTGIFGICRQKELRSAVMIRFIEKNAGRMLYKSGGGITLHSDPRSEYEELRDKIYLPI